jgi:hypothetical protein
VRRPQPPSPAAAAGDGGAKSGKYLPPARRSGSSDGTAARPAGTPVDSEEHLSRSLNRDLQKFHQHEKPKIDSAKQRQKDKYVEHFRKVCLPACLPPPRSPPRQESKVIGEKMDKTEQQKASSTSTERSDRPREPPTRDRSDSSLKQVRRARQLREADALARSADRTSEPGRQRVLR